MVQTVPVSFGRVMVWLDNGWLKINDVLKAPLYASSEVNELPCKVKLWFVEPIVKPALGLMLVRPVSEEISLFTPLAAAPMLVRADDADVAPVPPLVTARALLSDKPANDGDEVTAMFWGRATV